MGQSSMFFDYVLQDGIPDRQYSADEFAEYFRQVLTNGIFNGGTNLQVTHDVDMSINVNTGYAWVEGYMYKIDGSALSLTLDLGDSAYDRIDRIVLRLDTNMDARTISAEVLKGTPATTPSAPTLTRSGDIYELSLAQIYVAANAESITGDEITDERLDDEVCGLVNSLITVDAEQFEQEWNEWFLEQQQEGYFLLGPDSASFNKYTALNQRVDERSEVLNYDLDGNLIKVKEYETSAQNNLIKETNLTYTGGNLTQVKEISDGTIITQTLNYDIDGNLESVDRSVI